MWKVFKTFLAKFFSHSQTPIGMVPEFTTDVVSTEWEGKIEPLGLSEVVEITPKLGNEKLTENFNLFEFSCNNESKTPVPKKYLNNVRKLAENLQVLRYDIAKSINVNSGYRTPAYNKKVGGVKASQHMTAKAADIHVKGISPKKLGERIKKLIEEGKMDKGGLGIYKNFVHYDIRGVNRRWYGSGVKK